MQESNAIKNCVSINYNKFKKVKLSEIKTLLLEMKAQNTTKAEFSEYPELLSRKQAAQMVGVALTTIDRYTNEKLLTKHRNGKLVRFKKVEVLQAFKTFQKWQRL